MDKPRTTAKDFFLWAGAMVAFYWSVLAYIFLIFNYIDYSFPNALTYYPPDPYQSGISYEMASVIVLLPIYMLLMWLIRKDIVRDASRKEIWVRKWAIILTLFVASIAMAGDLITLLTTFLNGEALTTAFLLKVLVIFLVTGAAFMHFIADLRGYWDTYPARKRLVGIGVGVLAIVSIIGGFFIVGTPAQARLARFDAQKVQDLQNIRQQIASYWQVKRILPADLIELANSPYGPVPVDIQTGESYSYQATGAQSFKLCAMFNAASRGNQTQYPQTRAVMPAPSTPANIKGAAASQDDWQHGSGEVCFDRTLDPTFLPQPK